MLKNSALNFMWNPEIVQDPPTCDQDDLVLCLKIVQWEIFGVIYFKNSAMGNFCSNLLHLILVISIPAMKYT